MPIITEDSEITANIAKSTFDRAAEVMHRATGIDKNSITTAFDDARDDLIDIEKRYENLDFCNYVESAVFLFTGGLGAVGAFASEKEQFLADNWAGLLIFAGIWGAAWGIDYNKKQNVKKEVGTKIAGDKLRKQNAGLQNLRAQATPAPE